MFNRYCIDSQWQWVPPWQVKAILQSRRVCDIWVLKQMPSLGLQSHSRSARRTIRPSTCTVLQFIGYRVCVSTMYCASFYVAARMNGSSSKGYVVKSAVADKGNALSHPLFRPLGFNMRGCRNDMHVTMWLQLTICCINAVQASGGNGKQVSF